LPGGAVVLLKHAIATARSSITIVEHQIPIGRIEERRIGHRGEFSQRPQIVGDRSKKRGGPSDEIRIRCDSGHGYAIVQGIRVMIESEMDGAIRGTNTERDHIVGIVAGDGIIREPDHIPSSGGQLAPCHADSAVAIIIGGVLVAVEGAERRTLIGSTINVLRK